MAARGALIQAGFGEGAPLDILENGHPSADENVQAARLTAFALAVVDYAADFGVGSYTWFALWDADSASDNRFGHYGLLRSDLTPKPAFDRYRDLIARSRERP